MSENVMFRDKLRTLEKLAELGGEDRLMDQTITKLLAVLSAETTTQP